MCTTKFLSPPWVSHLANFFFLGGKPMRNSFSMSLADTPRSYEEWRTNSADRAEDAAYTFGYHLMQHCRREALKKIESTSLPTNSEELEAQVTAAVDTALHNVMDLLEGFWRTKTGENHTA